MLRQSSELGLTQHDRRIRKWFGGKQIPSALTIGFNSKF